LFQVEKLIQPLGRKDRPQKYARMQTTDAIDAPVPLNKPHWVPGHVQINDIVALLNVYALGQHVRRDEES